MVRTSASLVTPPTVPEPGDGPPPQGPEPGAAPGTGSGRSHLRRALRRFAASAVVALLLISGGTVLLAQNVARSELLRDARRTGQAVATGIVSPMVDRDVRAGDPAATAELDRVLRNRMADGSLVRVKVWSADGVVIWSDDSRLVGQSFELDPVDVVTLENLGATAEVSDLERDENVYEQDAGQLVEVYIGVLDADGTPVLFEAYLPTDDLRAESSSLVKTLLPITVGALLLLLVILLPLGVSLARRVDRAGAERAVLLRHAVAASALERRRIAGELHDGVVQDLAGIGYALPAITAQLRDGPGADASRQALARITEIVQRDVAALRSVITEIYPADLRQGGLAPALHQLAAHARRAGVNVEVRIADETLPSDPTVLAYRVVREALRNVVRHAQATTGLVVVERHDTDLVVKVEDNGVGFDGPVPTREGHVGLRLLMDTVRDLGGTFDIRSAAGEGTVVEARFRIDWASS